MFHPSPRRPSLVARTALVLAALLAAALPAAAQIEEPDEPAGPPIVRIEAHLERLRAQLQNAKMRLHNGIVSVDATHDGVPHATPIVRCCAQNLPRIEAAIRGIDLGLRDLATCSRAGGQEDARPELELVKFDLDAMVSALRSLVRAATAADADAVMGGTTRAFLNLEKSIDALPACGGDSAGE